MFQTQVSDTTASQITVIGCTRSITTFGKPALVRETVLNIGQGDSTNRLRLGEPNLPVDSLHVMPPRKSKDATVAAPASAADGVEVENGTPSGKGKEKEKSKDKDEEGISIEVGLSRLSCLL